MMPQQPPPRYFRATDILSGQVQLHDYPFTLICVGGGSLTPPLGPVLAAAELLESQGWRVINFEPNGRAAFLRREHRYGSPGRPAPAP